MMRKQKSGLIVNISSGIGRFGIPTTSAYVSTKFAIEGLSESMSYELEPFGIKTIIIEPGVIKTNFDNNLNLRCRFVSTFIGEVVLNFAFNDKKKLFLFHSYE